MNMLNYILIDTIYVYDIFIYKIWGMWTVRAYFGPLIVHAILTPKNSENIFFQIIFYILYISLIRKFK